MSSETQRQIETLEISIEQAKEAIKEMQAVYRLTKNPDFKAIVEKGYFENNASRLVLLRADPSMQNDTDQKQILKDIDGIGSFRQYLSTIIHFGRIAEESVKADEITREELLAEELNKDTE